MRMVARKPVSSSTVTQLLMMENQWICTTQHSTQSGPAHAEHWWREQRLISQCCQDRPSVGDERSREVLAHTLEQRPKLWRELLMMEIQWICATQQRLRLRPAQAKCMASKMPCPKRGGVRSQWTGKGRKAFHLATCCCESTGRAHRRREGGMSHPEASEC